MIIKLTKLDLPDLKFILHIVKSYAEYLQSRSFKKMEDKKDYAIAWELFYKIESKTRKQFPAKNNTLSLLFHQGMVLQDALLYYQLNKVKNTEYGSALIERYKMTLNPQLV